MEKELKNPEFNYSVYNLGISGDNSDDILKRIEFETKQRIRKEDEIIFIGLNPVDELKTTPIPWSIDKSYKNEYVSKYNNIIKSVCKKKQVNFIDMFEGFSKTDYKKLLKDGLHPNSKGHQKMFEVVRDYLMERGVVGE